MYIRIMRRKNRDGSVAEYVQLAHNYRDPKVGYAKPRILYNFGRREALDEDGLRRLVESVNRFLGPEQELASRAEGVPGDRARFIESKPMGSAWLLAGLWERLGIGDQLIRLANARQASDPEGLAGCIFAMVANRALAPLSKHATPDWLKGDVHVPGVADDVYDEQLYRAMDFLLDAADELQKTVFFATADLLNLDVDLLLYDTTSAYFEMADDDVERAERAARWAAHDAGEGPEPTRPRPQVVNEPPMRLRGFSRDSRPDVAQIVVGLAVTRQGIPVRCWVWPGNTTDAETVAQVKRDLAGWRLNRVVWAVDRGMVSEANLRELRRGGAHYIAGEKMRSGKREVAEALSRPGRYSQVRENLEVKEVVVGKGEGRKRYVVVRNPRQVARDREQRAALLARLQAEITRLNEGRPRGAAGRQEHTRAVCALKAHPTLGRYVRELKNGELRIDREKLREEQRLDGKYLVLSSDDTLSGEDIALGYKQLAEVENAWRSLKSELDLRPMFHRRADRICAHVLVCWLALLLVRVCEVRSGEPWSRMRQEMDRLHRGLFEGPTGAYVQRTEMTQKQRQLLKAVDVAQPPRFEAAEPAKRAISAAAR